MIIRLAAKAMGTRFEFVLVGDDERELRTIGEDAIEVIRDWHRRLSLFDRGSSLSHVNANATDRPVVLDQDLFELMLECLATHRDSGGAFDVTVAPLMRAYGFHNDCSSAVPSRDHTSMDFVELNAVRRTIRFADPRVALDLGGIAKGHALDDAAALVREAGVDCALMHGGTSTAVAIGAPSGADGWRVAVRVDGFKRIVVLRDLAMSVSAPHGRTIEHNGQRLGHVIDPRTGAPADRAVIAAVVGPSARRADAWSTALLVRGDRPAAMPPDYASLIGRPAADGVRVMIGGTRASAFDLRHGADEVLEEESCVSSTDARL
jgi:thiamine biosynthesis lipoprotein